MTKKPGWLSRWLCRHNWHRWDEKPAMIDGAEVYDRWECRSCAYVAYRDKRSAKPPVILSYDPLIKARPVPQISYSTRDLDRLTQVLDNCIYVMKEMNHPKQTFQQALDQYWSHVKANRREEDVESPAA